ncbi:saccharopine dehydrogenase-like oxidoreductase [Lepeophtheirus salmonis]|uniref:Saccharopine dehydrogenase NADP binding domain-containing protein n=1 Tax=Lepeophtheirus salmonis TaxID=72036 RepID=A0A0K2TXB5_LEPSM|nr:saccharopine dehydrogenase-like oxidoreductase [Lepeophtheirus salmonis]
MSIDIILLGASGYTGQYVVDFLVENLKSRPQMKWAAAGRSESKIRRVLDRVGIQDVPILTCDTSDSESLKAVVSQGRLVINCVGPYRFHGEEVVNACIESGVHHVDISGEPEYLEKMQLRYNQLAKDKGVYVVGSCGFDSIPADLGQIFLSNQMQGDVNEVETYLEVKVPDEQGPVINFATWQSAIYGFAFAGALKPIRKALYPSRLPSLNPRLRNRGNLHNSEIVGGWCLPFPGSDRSVMMRTQRFLHENEQKRPAQIMSYMKCSSLWVAIKIMIVGILFGLMATKKFGRSLLENYPRFFSWGAVSKSGPSKKMADGTDFKVTLIGKGWKDKVDDRSDDSKPDRVVKVSVSGKNIGYGSTCELVVQSALSILEESNKMPDKGGVFTPGYAFANTSIVERLTKKGIPFVVESIKDC